MVRGMFGWMGGDGIAGLLGMVGMVSRELEVVAARLKVSGMRDPENKTSQH
jgi:hypothetical protein